MPLGMWDLTFPARDRTRAPCIGSAESYPLDRQGIPVLTTLNQNSAGSSSQYNEETKANKRPTH